MVGRLDLCCSLMFLVIIITTVITTIIIIVIIIIIIMIVHYNRMAISTFGKQSGRDIRSMERKGGVSAGSSKRSGQQSTTLRECALLLLWCSVRLKS